MKSRQVGSLNECESYLMSNTLSNIKWNQQLGKFCFDNYDTSPEKALTNNKGLKNHRPRRSKTQTNQSTKKKKIKKVKGNRVKQKKIAHGSLSRDLEYLQTTRRNDEGKSDQMKRKDFKLTEKKKANNGEVSRSGKVHRNRINCQGTTPYVIHEEEKLNKKIMISSSPKKSSGRQLKQHRNKFVRNMDAEVTKGNQCLPTGHDLCIHDNNSIKYNPTDIVALHAEKVKTFVKTSSSGSIVSLIGASDCMTRLPDSSEVNDITLKPTTFAHTDSSEIDSEEEIMWTWNDDSKDMTESGYSERRGHTLQCQLEDVSDQNNDFKSTESPDICSDTGGWSWELNEHCNEHHLEPQSISQSKCCGELPNLIKPIKVCNLKYSKTRGGEQHQIEQQKDSSYSFSACEYIPCLPAHCLYDELEQVCNVNCEHKKNLANVLTNERIRQHEKLLRRRVSIISQ